MAQQTHIPDPEVFHEDASQTTPFIAYNPLQSPPIPPKSPLRRLSYFEPFPQLDPSLRLLSSSPPPLPTIGPQYAYPAPIHSPVPSLVGWKPPVDRSIVHYAELATSDPEIAQPQPAGNEYCDESCPQVSRTFMVTPDSSSSMKEKPVTQRLSKHERRKMPIYKRLIWIILVVLTVTSIAAAVAVGVIFGVKRSHPSSSSSSSSSTNAVTNQDLAVGGYLNPAYYSKTGAWNGTGVAIAAANPGVDQTTYAFYQDYQGNLTYKLVHADGTVTQSLGIVNDVSSNPLNGTPLSVVDHRPTPNNLVYHLFYIDENYNMVERILETNATNQDMSVVPLWQDGPLTKMKIKTLNSTSIGMQGCYWNNFYGGWKTNAVLATDAIQLWVATSETEFAQYTWTNGTSSWNFDQTWDGLNGHAGVGCQTWETLLTEYVWFVDQNQNIVMYWRDNDKDAITPASHPTQKWVKVPNLTLPPVLKSTSLGFTDYLIYQTPDAAVHGAAFNFSAQSTTLQSNQTEADAFVVQAQTNPANPVPVLRGTHMAVTAAQPVGQGAQLQIFFQQAGDDLVMYTADVAAGGAWSVGSKIV